MEAEVRDHASQHDALGELPLITDEARVTEVERMDRDRRPEVTDAIVRWLDDHGVLEEYGPIQGRSDWRRLHERLAADGHNIVARRIATLAERYDRPKPMLARACFETDEPVDFMAGQYLGLRYRGTPRAYSIASSPNRDDIEICVRRVPGGRLSPQLCDDLAVGDEVKVRGPYGDLVLKDQSSRDLVFLATGTGVAPFKGMIDYLFEEGRDVHDGERRDVWLFLGAAWEDDLPYNGAFQRRADDHENFHYVPCLSRESTLADWEGETDYVQHALLKHVDDGAVATGLGVRHERWIRETPDSGIEHRLHPDDIEVYACGINAMVYSLVSTVERLGVPESRITSEGFG